MRLSTGVLDTMLTSSASFVSYRLYEVLSYINAPRDYSIWYMAENLIVSKNTWDRLTPEQQKIFRGGCRVDATPTGSLPTSKVPESTS